MTDSDTAQVRLQKLISTYCNTAGDLLTRLKAGLGITSPLVPYVRERNLPREGEVGGVYYQVHGGGVSLSCGDASVDVQLGQDDYAHAFDAWRLAKFAASSGLVAEWTAAESLDELLKLAASQGTLEPYDLLGVGFYTRPSANEVTAAR